MTGWPWLQDETDLPKNRDGETAIDGRGEIKGKLLPGGFMIKSAFARRLASINLSGSAFRVALVLMDYVNARNLRCDPSISTIGRALSVDGHPVHEDTVRRAVHELVDAGLLVVVRPADPRGNKSQGYLLRLDLGLPQSFGRLGRDLNEDEAQTGAIMQWIGERFDLPPLPANPSAPPRRSVGPSPQIRREAPRKSAPQTMAVNPVKEPGEMNMAGRGARRGAEGSSRAEIKELVDALIKLGWTQTALAQAAGVPQGIVSRLVRAERSIAAHELVKIAATLPALIDQAPRGDKHRRIGGRRDAA